MTLRFTGLTVALATPFDADGRVDLPAYRALVQHCLRGGADVLCALGTTGESPTVAAGERDAVIEATLEEAAGTPASVIVGTGSNATAHAAEVTARAQQIGADGALVVSPYYNRPTPAGVVAHYAAIAQAAPGLPLMAYNVPGRTGANLAPATVAALWGIDEVVSLKEASGDLGQLGEIARTLPQGRSLLSGDDALALPSIALGAQGLVSVLGVALPAETKALVEAARTGDLQLARGLHQALLPLMGALFAETSPGPLKALLAHLGLCGPTLRLPLVEPEPATTGLVIRAYEQARTECSALLAQPSPAPTAIQTLHGAA